MEFIDWLTQKLKEKKLSVRELARRSKVSQPNISRVVNGKQTPTRDFCVAIAHGLELSEAEVLYQAGLLKDMPPGPYEPWVYEIVEIARQLTPKQREHIIALIKMVKDSTLAVYEAAPARGRQKRLPDAERFASG